MYIALVILVIAILLLSNLCSIYKQVFSNRIDRIYNEMEFYILKNEITLNKAFITFMRGHKAIKMDKRFADFEILGGLYQLIPQDKMKETRNSGEAIMKEHPELAELSRQFNKEVANLAWMHSIYHGIIFTILYKIAVLFVMSKRDSILTRTKAAYREIITHEAFIAGKGMEYGMAA